MNKLGHVYVRAGGTVPFEGVHLNEGGAYNQTDSTFICPLDGVYFFTVSLHSGNLSPESTTGVSLKLDETTLAAVDYNNNNENTIGVQCANSAVTWCSEGQKVQAVSDLDTSMMFGFQTDKESTFSGFLLRAEVQPI